MLATHTCYAMVYFPQKCFFALTDWWLTKSNTYMWVQLFGLTILRWLSWDDNLIGKKRQSGKKRLVVLLSSFEACGSTVRKKKINQYIVRDAPRERLLQCSWKLRACHMNPRVYQCQQTCLLAPSEHRECKLGTHIATAAKLPFWRLEGNLGGS